MMRTYIRISPSFTKRWHRQAWIHGYSEKKHKLYHCTEAMSRRVLLLFYNLDAGQNSKEQFYTPLSETFILLHHENCTHRNPQFTS
jgi:hypothetical protein